MIKIIILAIIVGVFSMLFEIFKGSNKENKKEVSKYNYERKKFLISPAEHECYNALVSAVGDKYYVFPQIHLSTFLDSKVIGQNWKGAFSHINQKSVDYVLCDKQNISPKLAIELNDKSHNQDKRVERDIEVKRILENAKFPLLTLENHGRIDSRELAEKINTILTSN